jgi:hypothetical protein
LFNIISSHFSHLNSLIFSIIYFVNKGSFSSFHLKGVGVKYGLSVSTNIFLRGMFLAVSCISFAFLNVTIPEKLILQLGENFKSLFAYSRFSL